MDEWIAGQNVLLKVAQDKQSKTDFHALAEYDPSINSYVFFLQSVEVISSVPDIEAHNKLWKKLTPSIPSKTWLMESESLRIFITYGLSTMIQRGQGPW